MNTAIVTCLFNPAGYRQRYLNYQKFMEHIGHPVFTIELCFNNAPVSNNSLVLYGSEQNIMWQKERLLNLLVSALPEKYKNVVWVDADILFDRPDWLEAVEEKLDEFPLVQCFSEVELEIDREGNYVRHKGYVAKGGRGHGVGYTWGIRRELFPLYDRAVLGGGDRLFLYAAVRRENDIHYGGNWLAHYRQWTKNRFPHPLKAGFVQGTIRHLWHGNPDNRGWEYRREALVRHSYDPEHDITEDTNGIWRWKDKPGLQKDVKSYFLIRREDSQ